MIWNDRVSICCFVLAYVDRIYFEAENRSLIDWISQTELLTQENIQIPTRFYSRGGYVFELK